MADPTDLVTQRTANALAAIKQKMSDEDSGVSLYVSHHLQEIESAYWQEHTGTTNPSAEQVINLLTLRTAWGEDTDDIAEVFDFTLPGNVTDYVLAVRFNEDGEVEDIDMES